MQNLTARTISLLNSKETQFFLTTARDFIRLIEDDGINKKEFYSQLHKKLTELYNAGLSLKPVDLVYSDENSEFEQISKEELKTKNINLIALLGKDSFYWEVFDPINEDNVEPSQGWLVDDVSDIYADLKEEINKIDRIATDESIEDGLWKLKFGFTTHWGNHCINAIRALHYLHYDGKKTV